MSSASAGVSSSASDVASTTRGPVVCKAAIARRAPATSSTGRPVTNDSSNALGVATVAAGKARLREEFGDARFDIDAASDVADHRIAAIGGGGIGGADGGDGAQHRFADFGLAEIAGEDAVAARERADRRQAGDAFVDRRRLEDAAAPAGIAGVAGELHGVERQHFGAEPLQRKRDGAVADMAVDDVRLDREQGRRHRRQEGRQFAARVKARARRRRALSV